jgi:hypothetical protein
MNDWLLGRHVKEFTRVWYVCTDALEESPASIFKVEETEESPDDISTFLLHIAT